jgi:glucosamine-6-phosphate deaminase
VEVIITSDYDSLSKLAAQLVIDLLNRKPDAVLGFATGSTPIGLYRELVRQYNENRVDFSQITTFNLDEYVGLSAEHPQSCSYFMREHLFGHTNTPEQSIYAPNGTTTNHEAFCQWYEGEIQRLGGIDLQILGIGGDGHLACNEPGSSLGSRARLKTLMEQTVTDNARFIDDSGDVPRYSITMGVGTILEARHCILVAAGENKAEPVARAIEGPVTSLVTASALQLHQDVTVVLDEAAASKLQLRDYYRNVHENKPQPGDAAWHFRRA